VLAFAMLACAVTLPARMSPQPRAEN